MIIIAHKYFNDADLFNVNCIKDIQKTPSNSTLIIDINNIELVQYARKNSLNIAFIVTNEKEAIFSEKLGAKYIISKLKLAKSIQKIADNYLFDAKILAIIKDENTINKVSKLGIDGIIFKNF